MIDYDVKTNIRRSIKTGELLHLDYMNKNKQNKFYFIGIKSMDFDGDDTKITGHAFNYQYDDPVVVTIPINRIQNAKCVEGTKNFFSNNLSGLMKVPKINDYFNNETSDKGLFNYYVECVEGSTDLQWLSTYLLNTVDAEILLENKKHSLTKEETNEVLMMLNVDEQKNNTKYRLAFNIMGITNFQKELIPLVYYDILLDVFNKELKLNTDEVRFHKKNISDILHIPINDVEEYNNVLDLRSSVEEEIRSGYLLEGNPSIMKLKLDLSFSVRKDYKLIRDAIYKKGDMSDPLRAFFGKYEKELMMSNKNIYFTNNKVNSKQIEAVFSSMNNKVTYVQGPPGTGKTQTITNIVISSFMNRETTLITSYTNEAVNNIFRKMKVYKYKDVNIPIPMLRLGAKKYSLEGLKYLRDAYKYYLNLKKVIDLRKLQEKYTESIEKEIRKLAGINELFNDNQKFEDAEMKVGVYSTLIEAIPDNSKNVEKLSRAKRLRASQKGILTKLSKKDLDNYLDSIEFDYEIIKLGLLLESVRRWELLDEDTYSDIKSVLINDGEATGNDFYRFTKNEELLSKLKKVFPIILTTNISSRSIGESTPSFDLLIMDEAGQCENAYAIVALSKAHRAALIGDPNQLLPVVTLIDSENEILKTKYNIPDVYDYKQTSILNTMNQVDFQNEIILLSKHYRCKKSIVDFANRKYYNSALEIINENVSEEDCKFFNIESSFYRGKKNTSVNEAIAIIEELKKLPANQSVGIITPYRNQQSFLNKQIKKHLPSRKVKIGTVHKFQGQEEDVIMLSLAIGRNSYKGSYDWLKNNKQLINVATTRPIEKLYLFGDKQSIERLSEGEHSDITDLINYTSKYNATDYYKNSVGMEYSDINKKSLYFGFESLFADTLQRVLLINHKGLMINSQTSVQQVMRLDKSHALFEYASRAAFDFVIVNSFGEIQIAFELCGPEHAYDPLVKKRDALKLKICRENNVDLLFVNNRDSRRYSFLKEVLQVVFEPASE